MRGTKSGEQLFSARNLQRLTGRRVRQDNARDLMRRLLLQGRKDWWEHATLPILTAIVSRSAAGCLPRPVGNRSKLDISLTAIIICSPSSHEARLPRWAMVAGFFL